VVEWWTIREGPVGLCFGVLGGVSPPIGASKQKHYSITPLLHYSITPLLHYSITPLLHYSITPELLQLLNSFFKGTHENSRENRLEPDLV
jgi:hypothetical protein